MFRFRTWKKQKVSMMMNAAVQTTDSIPASTLSTFFIDISPYLDKWRACLPEQAGTGYSGYQVFLIFSMMSAGSLSANFS